MTKLLLELQPYARQVVLGDATPGPSLDALRGRLERIVSANRVYARLCVAFTVLLFAVAVAVIIVHLSRAEVVQVVLALLAAATCGIIYVLRSLWREKVATEILIALTDAFEGDALRTVVDTFVRWLR